MSFLVDDLVIRRGGVAANIAYGMGLLGAEPVLVGAVGDDFADYRSWLERHGVDTRSVWVSDTAHTPPFVCTTDTDLNQIASFYPGAMSEARQIELGPVAERLGGIGLVVVSPNDPAAMLRHTAEAKERGIPFMADPSQQMAGMDGDSLRSLIDGAAYLVTNDYERDLLAARPAGTPTRSVNGSEPASPPSARTAPKSPAPVRNSVQVPVVAELSKADPTGVGDAFRAGLLSGLVGGLDLIPAARLGSLLATYTLETLGTQEYSVDRTDAIARLTAAYGADAATEITPLLPN